MARALTVCRTERRPGDLDTLWAACLGIVEARRAGRPVRRAPDGLIRDGGAGWQLDGRPWEAEARSVFELSKPMLDRGPRDGSWVIAQLGQSLDGFVATASGDSRFVNCPENLTHLHRLRALADAVIVGARTLAEDDPRLTTRLVPGAHPTRVVFDPALGLRGTLATRHLFSDQAAPSLLLCDARHREMAGRELGMARCMAVEGLLTADGGVDVAVAVAALGRRGLRLLFVEGGGVTVSRFLTQGCLDRLHLGIAPILIGDGRPGLRFPGPARLAECARPAVRIHAMGCDQLWDLDLSPRSSLGPDPAPAD